MLLVTGGLGYLGGRIALNFAKKGQKIRIGTRAKPKNDPFVFQGMALEYVSIDFSDERSLVSACEGISKIIHLASLNAIDSEKNPDLAFEVNTVGTENLLKAAKQQGVKKFIYFSTVHVYGKPLTGYFNENSIPNPCHPYSKSHYLAENILLDAVSRKDIDGLIFRLSNAVGPPISASANCWMLFVNQLCRQAVVEGSMTVQSDGDIERDFLPISFILSVLGQCLEDGNNFWQFPIINLVSGKASSLRSISELVRSRAKIVLGQTVPCKIKSGNQLVGAPKLQIDNKNLRRCYSGSIGSLESEIDKLLVMCKNWFE